MAYMKKNINFGLLALLLGMIMVFIGFTLYYQQTFNTLASNYTTKLSQLEKVTQDLSKHKSILTKTESELNQTTIDVEALSQDYEDLEAAKAVLQGNLDTTKSNLKTRTSELSAEKKRTRELNDEVAANKVEINKWKGLYNAKVVDYNESEYKLKKCKRDLAKWPGKCNSIG